MFSCSGIKKIGFSGSEISEGNEYAFMSPDSLNFEYDYNFLQTLYLDAKTALLLGDTTLAFNKFNEALQFIAIKNGDGNFSSKFENLNKKIATEYSNLLEKSPQFSGDSPADFLKDEIDELDIDSAVAENIPKITTKEIQLVENNTVHKVLDYLLKNKKKSIENYLVRSTRYMPFIKQIFREEGLPEDLSYLAAIESGFNPIAYSRAHAVGMWQFIYATGKNYGLEKNFFIDERRDFIKSTRAAAKHLKDLYKLRDNWYLALANYNCSSRRIDRAIHRHRTTNFWKLRTLPRQTRSYIPLYIATTLIFKNPEKYGFDIEYEPPLSFETVELEHSFDLKDISDWLEMDIKTLRKVYNPELRTRFTPPVKDKKYKLRIPDGSKEIFLAKLDSTEAESRNHFSFYKVQKNDNINRIAKKFGVNSYLLRRVNDLSVYERLKKDEIIVPISEVSQKFSDYLASTGEFGYYYSVRRGDTLERIARRFGVRVRDLMRWNDLTSHFIYPGQRLNIIGRNDSYDVSGKERIIYIVRRGDSLSEIAEQFGVGLSRLRRWNNVWTSRIYPGQRLKIYLSSNSRRTPANGKHIVVRGESLDRISKMYSVNINQLKEWNNLKSDIIYPGQQLKVVSDTSLNNSPNKQDNGEYIEYRVRFGDTLWEISRRYNVSISQIMYTNNLRTSIIKKGQILILPSTNVSKGNLKTDENGHLKYTVRYGDTLWHLSRRYGVSIEKIKVLNNLDRDIIRPGDVLLIPN